MLCTGITYTDWLKEIRYEFDPVVIAKDVATVVYPQLRQEDIERIEATTYDRVQSILSQYF